MRRSSVDDLIALLRSRFGTVNQREHYRAELRSLMRQKDDTLQFVYQEVRLLMTLTFPGQSGTLLEVMAGDAFIDALSNTVDRVRMLRRWTRR